MLIAELCAEHRELEAHTAELLRIVAAEAPDSATVAGMRWRIVRALADHCEREDRQVYDRLLGSGDAIATVLALRCRQEHGVLVDRFTTYILDWPVDRITREWASFGEATRAAVALIAARTAREEQLLFPHASRVMARRAA
ncbi:hemerythrin domain-containing protein [Sphingomonas sp. S2-65]|uniref:hemerythrin domain-containing protein n=1 Tax=Sphingomonas sp. S2-65 TaxID=2903960 RepID=UPI001F251FAB|nr:hemerythrin domain-containing protein [Sphingomonas sp. S2-65]UYY60184.1 hemerythrin domain-containing protein [Sphingomonas sp. S2-65]